MKIKSLIFTAILTVALLCSGGVISAQSTDSTSQLSQLQAQIASLMAQLNALQGNQGNQGTTTTWCYTFNSNLKFGDSGEEVLALDKALEKEGFSIDEQMDSPPFAESTAAAVVKFQQKYGINATGFVGPVTRAKLNKLYGCRITQSNKPSIKITSPDGKETWTMGRNNTITWKGSYPASGYVSLMLNHYNGDTMGIIKNIFFSPTQPLTNQSYVWDTKTLTSVQTTPEGVVVPPDNITLGGLYQVRVVIVDYTSSPAFTNNIVDSSAFKIVAPSNMPAITVTSPNGGESWKVGETHNIMWTSQGSNATNYNVQIGIIDTRYSTEAGPRAEQIIANSIPNSGSYSWTIPQTIGTMSLNDTNQAVYKIIIHSWSDSTTGVALAGSSVAPFIITSATTTQPSASLTFVSSNASYSYNASNPANSVATGVITYKVQASGGTVSPIISNNVIVQVCSTGGSCTTVPSNNVNVTASPSGYISDGTTATITVNAVYTGGSGYIYFKISEIDWTIGDKTTQQFSGLDNYKTPAINTYGGATVVNGACGTANGITTATAPTTNLCSVGTATVVSGSGPWTWICAGSTGAISAPCSAPKTTLACTDSDGGQDIYTKGSVTGIWDFYTDATNPASMTTHSDYCRVNYGYINGLPAGLGEYSCNSNGRKTETYFSCANGCLDGACVRSSTQPTAILTLVSTPTINYNYNPITPADSVASGVFVFQLEANSDMLSQITSSNIVAQVCNSNNACTALPLSNVSVVSSPSGNIPFGVEATVTVNVVYKGGSGYLYFKISEINWTVGGITTRQISGLEGYKTPSINAVGLTTTCTPNWQVGDWGACATSFQTRTVTDLNNCGTTTGKPVTYQYCIQASVNGACGTANGLATTTAPTTNLCLAAGSVTPVVGSGPWTWSCVGANGGPTANCSAPKTTTVATAPSCGTSNGITTTVMPITGLCASGTANVIGQDGLKFVWYCMPPVGNVGTKYCTALIPSSSDNGVCGPASKAYSYTDSTFAGALCSKGAASPSIPSFPTPSNLVNWTCVGTNGVSAICSASRGVPIGGSMVNGVCGTAVNSCISGYSAPNANGTWLCAGSGGGATVDCPSATSPTASNISQSSLSSIADAVARLTAQIQALLKK